MADEENLIIFDDIETQIEVESVLSQFGSEISSAQSEVDINEILSEFESDIRISQATTLSATDSVFSDTESTLSSQIESGQTPKYKISTRTLQFEFVVGKRRDKKVLHSIAEHQLYVRNKQLVDGTVAYTCQTKSCRARVFLKDDKCYFSDPFVGHIHASKESTIADMSVMSDIKMGCEQPSASQTTSQISEVREIFDKVVMQ